MSLEIISENSYAVQVTKKFASRFSELSNLERAVVGIAMLIVGPVALAALILGDILRGGAYIADGLYNWKDKSVASEPVLLPLNPAEKIHTKAKALAELENKRETLAEEVIQHILNSDMGEGELSFVTTVIDELGEKGVDFVESFKRKFVNKKFFLDEFKISPEKALLELIFADALLFENIQFDFDQEDEIAIGEKIYSELRKIVENENPFNEEHFLSLIQDLEKKGLVKGMIDVNSMYIEISNLYGRIKVFKSQVAAWKEQNALISDQIEHVKAFDAAIVNLDAEIGEKKIAVEDQKAKLLDDGK